VREFLTRNGHPFHYVDVDLDRDPTAQELSDLLIIGAGPAGLAAAAYGASEGLRRTRDPESCKRHLMVASLRYLDTFVKTDGAWLFAERLLFVDWADERALSDL
jgi:hypothetical protein